MAAMNATAERRRTLIHTSSECDADLVGYNASHILPLDVVQAAHSGDLSCVTQYLANGGRIDAQCPQREGDTMLMAATVGGATLVVRKLLKLNASLDLVNDQGLTALMGVAQIPVGDDSAAIACLLLRAGARANECSQEGATTLVHAVEKSGAAKLVEALLRGGACPDLPKHDGSSALMSAAHLGMTSVVTILIRAGAAIDMQNVNGATALMAAAQQGHVDTVRTLLKARADAELKSNGPQGMSALQWAELGSHDAVAQMIRGYIAEQAAAAEREAAAAAQLALRQQAADAMMAELLSQELMVESARPSGKGRQRRTSHDEPSRHRRNVATGRHAVGSRSLDDGLAFCDSMWDESPSTSPAASREWSKTVTAARNAADNGSSCARFLHSSDDSTPTVSGRLSLPAEVGAGWQPPKGVLRVTPPEISGNAASYIEELRAAGLSREDTQAAAALLARRQQRGSQQGGRSERHTL